MDPTVAGAHALDAASTRQVPVPRMTRVLSNGRYTVLLHSDGTGVSCLNEQILTSWGADPILDTSGLLCFVRDPLTGHFESVGARPVGPGAGAQPVTAPPGNAGMTRILFGAIRATLEVAVPPEGSFEVRRLVLTNPGPGSRTFEVTTYGEVVLAPVAAHAAHPGFSKLFVQTERDAATGTLLAHRRPRSGAEQLPWLFHALVGVTAAEFETDRTLFIGRGCTLDSPAALRTRGTLSGTLGNVLDPIVCLRTTVEVAPGDSATVAFVLGAAADRESALAGARRFGSAAAVSDAFAAAREDAAARLSAAHIGDELALRFEALAGAMIDGVAALRAGPAVLARAQGDRDDAARLGVLPGRFLAVLHAEEPGGAALVPLFVAAARYWNSQALPIDAVILADEAAFVPEAAAAGARIVRVHSLGRDEIDALDAWAAMVVWDQFPAVTLVPRSASPVVHAVISQGAAAVPGPVPDAAGEPARGNGIGDFSPDGREYVMQFRAGEHGLEGLPPQPWTNVIANEHFGCVVSETGSCFTWSRNSREHRLTPWFNDPLLDPHGEALYVRDDDEGWVASPQPGPARVPGTEFTVRHGLGFSRFQSTTRGIEHDVVVFVPPSDPVRIVHWRLVNRSDRTRRLSLYSYAQWVLGTSPDTSGRFVCTTMEADSGTIFARNAFAEEFAPAQAFAAVVAPPGARAVHATADRLAFLGPHGSLARPDAVRAGGALEEHVGPGLDACAAQQVEIELPAGAVTEVVFLLGEITHIDAARALIQKYRAPGAVDAALDAAHAVWTRGAGRIQISTPVRALDQLTNAWLPYQVLSCRIWGRSAFYQSGGAFGFRDQLQDATSLVYLWPEVARAQVLLNAAHQFPEGDVLHWWHPPLGRGIRTRFADDLLWLPYLTAYYIETTGDTAVLAETAPFVQARALAPGEDEIFLLPERGRETADVYEHCCRALDRSLTRGAHGLPLFGTGDWNDGMNRVGREGRGESVWMAFFLDRVLADFTPYCEQRGDTARVQRYAAYREELRGAIETAGWDGAWYRRGYYDDGAVLGSKESDECQIDALVQAWAVLSGTARRDRAVLAMESAGERLISEPDQLIRLLAPPFVNTPHDPGYIKGYVAGVRENGGQYTHGALWVVRAFAELGRNDRVAPLLEMLAPQSHTRTATGVERYRVEPYVMAADVYGAPPHVGRGGWTWYTGSAGWMYRVVLESLLGFRIEGGESIVLQPCVPDGWPEFRLQYQASDGKTVYDIRARNPHASGAGVATATLDGAAVPVVDGTARIPLRLTGRTHQVEIVLGGAPQPAAGPRGEGGA